MFSGYCNDYYCTCDSCVLKDITHHYDCNSGSHICGIISIWSVQCASATTVDPEGHNEGFDWPCYCASAATT